VIVEWFDDHAVYLEAEHGPYCSHG
jgi:hypothetical protein